MAAAVVRTETSSPLTQMYSDLEALQMVYHNSGCKSSASFVTDGNNQQNREAIQNALGLFLRTMRVRRGPSRDADFDRVRHLILAALRDIHDNSCSGFEIGDHGLLVALCDLCLLVQPHIHITLGCTHCEDVILDLHDGSDHMLESAVGDEPGRKGDSDDTEAHEPLNGDDVVV